MFLSFKKLANFYKKKKKIENIQFQVIIYIYSYGKNKILIREQYILLCKKTVSGFHSIDLIEIFQTLLAFHKNFK